MRKWHLAFINHIEAGSSRAEPASFLLQEFYYERLRGRAGSKLIRAPLIFT